jgi:putative transposase
LDATIITTESHEKAYLQFVLDNFLKRIMAWQSGDSISGFHTTELLKSTFASLSPSPPESIDLIVDGGPGNNNQIVSAYLEGTPIRKLIAQVDIVFSNSMIEAVNKILKYRYIFRTPIPNLDHLNETIAAAIGDYNVGGHDNSLVGSW